MKNGVVNFSWFEKKAENCNELANVLYIIDNYHNGKLNDEEITFAAELFKKDSFPLPSDRTGNLIAIALELGDFEMASKFIETGSISTNKVVFDEQNSLGVIEWIESYKESNPENVGVLDNLLSSLKVMA